MRASALRASAMRCVSLLCVPLLSVAPLLPNPSRARLQTHERRWIHAHDACLCACHANERAGNDQKAGGSQSWPEVYVNTESVEFHKFSQHITHCIVASLESHIEVAPEVRASACCPCVPVVCLSEHLCPPTHFPLPNLALLGESLLPTLQRRKRHATPINNTNLNMHQFSCTVNDPAFMRFCCTTRTALCTRLLSLHTKHVHICIRYIL